MVGAARLELATSASQTQRATNCAMPRQVLVIITTFCNLVKTEFVALRSIGTARACGTHAKRENPLPQIRSLPRWLPLGLLLITLIALFYRLLVGDVLFWGLPSLQFYPWRSFAMTEFAAGRFPLWNPYNGAGAPLLANYQSALLYPPHALYWLWSGPQMMGYLGMLHLLWAGLGMWLLTGRMNSNLLGRGIATLAYPLSNTIVARFGTFPMVDVAAWLPWLLLTLDLLIDRVTLERFLALVAVVVMMLLAGHAQWTFYSFLLAGVYTLYRIWRDRRSAWILVAAGAAILLSVGIAAAQLLPTLELQRQSQRAVSVTEDFALNFSYNPLSLMTLLNPNFFGNPGDGSFVVGGAYFELAAYVGFLPLVLAVFGTIHYLQLRRRKKTDVLAALPHGDLIPFFAAVAIISLILAFGRYGIYPLLYRYMPTFNLFQAPARWLLLTVFSLSMLVSLVVPLWKPERRAMRRARMALLGGISMAVLSGIAQLVLANGNPITVQMLRGLTVLGLLIAVTAWIFVTQPADEHKSPRWVLIVLLFVALDLCWADALDNPTVAASFYDPRPAQSSTRIFIPDPQNQALPTIAFDKYLPLHDYRIAVDQQTAYRQSNLPDLNLLDRQPSLNSFDPLRPDSFERFMRLLNANSQPGLLRAAGVGDSAPRVWMVPAATAVDSLAAAEQIIGQVDWDPQKMAVIEGSSNFSGSQDVGTAQITNETPLDVSIHVQSPGGGVLILADTYYPGWQATLDSQSATIYRANVNFRAVVVPVGEHTVRFVYRPLSFLVGAGISLASLIGFGLLALIAGVRLHHRSNARRDHVDGDQIVAPLRDDHVGVTFAGLDELQVHRADRS